MTTWKMIAACLSFLALAGCRKVGAAAQEEDIAEYEALQDELEQARKAIVETRTDNLSVGGNRLFWTDSSIGNPILMSYDQPTGQFTTYKFIPHLTGVSGLNPHDTVNYFASSTIIATMNVPDGANVYAPGKEEELLGKLDLPAPPYGQRWWAYSVDAGDLYVTVQGEDKKYRVQKWRPGDAAAQEVAVLDDLVEPNLIGNFLDFAVSGDTLIFAESGRVWMAALSGLKAKWVKNEKEVIRADFDASGVVYTEGADFFRYDRASDSRVNLSEKIRNNAYQMNVTYAEAHFPESGAWFKFEDKIVYPGREGIFVYDIGDDTVTPVLLHARDNSIVYAHPVVIQNGTLFVQGFESQSGSIGTKGPTFELNASVLGN